MKKYLIFTILTAAFISPAVSSDMDYYDPSLYRPAAVTPVAATTAKTVGLYVAGRVGGAILHASGTQSILDIESGEMTYLMDDDNKSDIGMTWRGAIGYDFNPIRIEAEYTYGHLFDSNDELDYAFGIQDWKMENRVQTVMANVYYDIDLGKKITPFIGLGAGWGQIREEISIVDIYEATVSDNNFVWGASAGISWKFTDSLAGEFGYKFSDLGSVETTEIDRHYMLHEVALGLRYTF